MSPPELSAIVLVPPEAEAVRALLGALSRQTLAPRMELVLVTLPGTSPPEVPDAFAGVRHVVSPRPGPDSRAAGVRAASAPVVAFTEDHCFPAPGWAEALAERHRDPAWTGVGPAVANANPASGPSWANFLLEYGEWASPAVAREVHHMPGHNSSYKRDRLLALGPDLARALDSESTLHWRLGAAGHRFFLEPRAVVRHYNFSVLSSSLGLRFQCGRLFAARRVRGWPLPRRLLLLAASPLIPLVRLLRTARMVLRLARSGARVAPVPVLATLAVFAMADGLGEGVGYATGECSRALAACTDAEHHRERYLDPADRARFDGEARA